MDYNQKLNIEQDFWSDFTLEAFEHIEEIETNVITLEQNPEDMDIIHTMFRAFHTIKGLSGFVEHTIIQEIAHKTETMMDYCRKGELTVTTAIVDAILKSSDYIKRLCEDAESYTDNSFIDQINALLDTLEELSNVETPKVETGNVEQEAEVSEIPSIEEEKEEVNLDAFAAAFSEFTETPIEETEEEAVNKGTEEQRDGVIEQESQPSLPQAVQPSACLLNSLPKEETGNRKEETVVSETTSTKTDGADLLKLWAQGDTKEETKQETEVLKTPPTEKEEPVVEQIIEPKTEPTIKKVEETPAIKEPEIAKVEIKQEEKPEAEKILKQVENDVKSEILSTAQPISPSAPKEEAGIKKVIAPNEEYMKVANNKIDHLVEMIGELIINQSLIDQYISSHYSNDNQLITNMSGFLRITRELQSLSMSLRMVSLKPTFQKISRIARDTIQELHKDVEFVTCGESTEIDRVVTDKLLDPLVHLIKNAISHGVETDPEDRIKSGKNKRAKVELNAYSKRGKIFIEIKDDGRGINTEVVYKKALEKGLIDPTRNYSQDEIKEFILLPGFSTAEVVDNISGRGVGMDVVKTQVLKIGGKVIIESELKKGSTFTLEIPVNHAIMNGTVIDMNGQEFIVPTMNVKEILQPQNSQWIFTQQKRTMIRVREDIIPLIPLSLFFKGQKTADHVPLVMLLDLDGELRALPITNVINRQEVVVKPVGEEFSHLQYISGMSILGTGKVSLILDIDYLFKKEVKE